MTVREAYLSQVHSVREDEEQKSILSYHQGSGGLGTAISVVTDPTGGIVDVTDEHRPELGMPRDILDEFRNRRRKLEGDVNAHNRAAEELSLEEQYKEHLKEGDARKAVEELSERVDNGEKITLVCFEKAPKWCHRRVLKDIIESRVE